MASPIDGADRSTCRRLRIYIVGDFGTGDRFQLKVADAMALLAAGEPPDLILGTGDCVYPGPPDGPGIEAPSEILARRFDPYYEKLATEFYQCVGNHDLADVFGGDVGPMISHARRSRVWRMPGLSYSIPGLPPWVAVHVLNSNVFGFDGHVAEPDQYSETAMRDELDAAARCFSHAGGIKILVGHHPVFTPGKRTMKNGGDGELRCMRRVRELIQSTGIHFYLSGHEHHQSHTTGSACEYIVQGCGGAGVRANPRHVTRPDGARLPDKVFRYLKVMNGFAVLELDSDFRADLRFIGVPSDAPATGLRVIYRYRWSGLREIGDPGLLPCPRPAAAPRRTRSG
jgi:hypothetical protein